MSADFLDSNVLVYMFDETDSRKRGIARHLVVRALDTRQAVVSYQVVQEVLNVLTTKHSPPLSSEDARRFLDTVLVPLWDVMPSAELHHRALDIRSRYGYSFYDSLIIAAALEAGCSRLYSEDLHDGQQVERLIIENPFRLANGH